MRRLDQPDLIYQLALNYCSRRETSRERLRLYLVRKIQECARQGSHPAATELSDVIDGVLNRLVEKKIVDDQRYADILVRDLKRRGKGHRYVRNQMQQKGLGALEKTLATEPSEELTLALEQLEKWLNRSSVRKIEDRYELKQKLIQKLARSGFDLTICKKAVALKLDAHSTATPD